MDNDGKLQLLKKSICRWEAHAESQMVTYLDISQVTYLDISMVTYLDLKHGLSRRVALMRVTTCGRSASDDASVLCVYNPDLTPPST